MKYSSFVNTHDALKEVIYASKDTKDKMGLGVWLYEEDFIQFHYNHSRVDTYFEANSPIVVVPGSSFLCMAQRGPLQNWNGYVGVGQDSALFGLSYGELGERFGWDIPAHGGLTIANTILPFKRNEKRPHEQLRYVHNQKGWARKKWFFGFDCAHSGDLIPNKEMQRFTSLMSGEYRDQKFIIERIKALAAHLLKIETALKQNHPRYVY